MSLYTACTRVTRHVSAGLARQDLKGVVHPIFFMIVYGRDPKVMTNVIKHFVTYTSKFGVMYTQNCNLKPF